jgi:hypothetical protein
MDEHEACIRINLPNVVEREHMIRRFQDPPAAGEIGVQMLKKATMEAIGMEQAVALQPAAVRRDSVGALEAQALEHVRGDVRALLGRINRDRVKGIELGGKHPEQGELQSHPPPAQGRFEAARPRCMRIYELK